jgi:hypothetical protein
MTTIRCRLCEQSVRTVAGVNGCCVLVVLENPWIHCPAEQTTIELVELVDMGAARATKRVVKMASRVDSISEIV